MVHDLLPFWKVRAWRSVAPDGIERLSCFFLTRAVTNSRGNLVSHLTFYFKHRLYWQPRYSSGIWIVTCSACAFQKNQVLFQTRIRSLNSARLFTLKRSYQCHPPQTHLQVFLVFCFTWTLLKTERLKIMFYVSKIRNCWLQIPHFAPCTDPVCSLQKPAVPSILPHIIRVLQILIHEQPCSLLLSAHVTVELCSKLSRKCFLLTTPRDKPAQCTGCSVPSVLSVRGK